MKIAAYWFLGFVLLVGILVFMKRVLFEFLHWNGTTKNDWAYILWWIVVFAWTFFGTTFVKRKITQ
jgi:hypothetical protein